MGSEGNMKVYKCIVNDSEFITDAQTEDGEMLWGGTWCKVAGKYITIGEEDIDIGANASADGADADEGVDENAQQVIDIVHSFLDPGGHAIARVTCIAVGLRDSVRQ